MDPAVFRSVDYRPGERVFAHWITAYGLPGDLAEGDPLTLVSWQSPYYIVRDAAGHEFELMIIQLNPAYEIRTIHGWPTKPIRLLCGKLWCNSTASRIPSSQMAPERVATGAWHRGLQILRRNGSDAPLEVLATAHTAGLLPVPDYR